MTKNYWIFIMLLFSCMLLSISFASANDNITLDDSSCNMDYQNKTPSINNNDLSTDDIDEDSSNTSSINKSKSFTDLNKLINNDLNKSEVILEDDYIYQEEYDRNFAEGIFINRSVIIDGQGHVIDAQSKSRIFNIKADDVVIKNIILMNAHFYKYLDGDEITISTDVEFFEVNTMGHFNGYNGVSYGLGKFKDEDYASIAYVGETYDGYAIYGSGNNLKIINSSFINNHAHFGGAIYIDGNNSMLVNLTFNNNSACIGGAIHNRGINTKLINLTFNNNSALVGGAISNMGKSIVDTCQFYLNDAKYRGNMIYSGGQGNISIQKCGFGNECGQSISFQCEEWQINNITSTYFNSLVKLDIIDFRYDLTHLHEEYYNLKITFGLQPYWYPNAEFCEDYFGYSVNKKFCLNIDGKVYNLQTNEKSQVEIDLKLSSGSHFIEIYNPLTKENIIKSFNVSDPTYNIQPTNKSKSFTDLNKLINNDLNKSEIILEDDYIYQEEYDRNFAEGIFINRSVIIDGQGHVIDSNNSNRLFVISVGNVILKNIKFNIFSNNSSVIFGSPIFINSTSPSVILVVDYSPIIVNKDVNNSNSENSTNVTESNLDIGNSTNVTEPSQDVGNSTNVVSKLDSDLVIGIYDDVKLTLGDGGVISGQIEVGQWVESGSIMMLSTKDVPNFVVSIDSKNDSAYVINNNIIRFKNLEANKEYTLRVLVNDTKYNSKEYVKQIYIYGDNPVPVTPPLNPQSNNKTIDSNDSINSSNLSVVNNTNSSNGTGSDSGIVNSTGSNTETNTNSSEPSQDVGNGTDVSEPSHDIGNNTNVTEPSQDMKNNANKNQNTVSTSHKTTIVKSSPKVIAKNKNFNKKTKIKKYTLTLKNKSKSIKNVWVTLKIKGKTFKAKTNNKGQATFKITTLNKKGKFAAKIIFKGNKYYSSANKNVKIVVK